MHEFGKPAPYLYVTLLLLCVILISNFPRCDKFEMFLRYANYVNFMLRSRLQSPIPPSPDKKSVWFKGL
jgi:hypothetical protein